MREAFFAPEASTIMQLFKDLKRTKNHLAVIIDEYAVCTGIVTMEDVLEEIVGEIQDEFDAEENDFQRLVIMFSMYQVQLICMISVASLILQSKI